jgi:hypothetical protein
VNETTKDGQNGRKTAPNDRFQTISEPDQPAYDPHGNIMSLAEIEINAQFQSLRWLTARTQPQTASSLRFISKTLRQNKSNELERDEQRQHCVSPAGVAEILPGNPTFSLNTIPTYEEAVLKCNFPPLRLCVDPKEPSQISVACA